mmetsp:Transcript_106366/g.307817  ORF Transcript_106366/g.307817 Transcript_106366/m.307817 type:complete len:290 (-) Transcript_106366:25-894(-)
MNPRGLLVIFRHRVVEAGLHRGVYPLAVLGGLVARSLQARLGDVPCVREEAIPLEAELVDGGADVLPRLGELDAVPGLDVRRRVRELVLAEARRLGKLGSGVVAGLRHLVAELVEVHRDASLRLQGLASQLRRRLFHEAVGDLAPLLDGREEPRAHRLRLRRKARLDVFQSLVDVGPDPLAHLLCEPRAMRLARLAVLLQASVHRQVQVTSHLLAVTGHLLQVVTRGHDLALVAGDLRQLRLEARLGLGHAPREALEALLGSPARGRQLRLRGAIGARDARLHLGELAA